MNRKNREQISLAKENENQLELTNEVEGCTKYNYTFKSEF